MGESSRNRLSHHRHNKSIQEDKETGRVGTAYPNSGKLLESNGKPALSFLLHFAAATLDGTGATFGDNHLRTAFAAEVHFPDLICHESLLLF